MHRKYDLFEKFPDGSSLWRACVLGLGGTYLHMQELAKTSENRFYAIDIWSGKIVVPNSNTVAMHLSLPFEKLEDEARRPPRSVRSGVRFAGYRSKGFKQPISGLLVDVCFPQVILQQKNGTFRVLERNGYHMRMSPPPTGSFRRGACSCGASLFLHPPFSIATNVSCL